MCKNNIMAIVRTPGGPVIYRIENGVYRHPGTLPSFVLKGSHVYIYGGLAKYSINGDRISIAGGLPILNIVGNQIRIAGGLPVANIKGNIIQRVGGPIAYIIEGSLTPLELYGLIAILFDPNKRSCW